jgi:hypothetical protein
MTGETEADVSGWTVDTLHAHMQRQINDMRSSLDERNTAYVRMIDDMRTALDERYATQTKALDAALIAQQTAMQTAFTAADKAVAAALEAAEKAVGKAETAAEKRFDAVNEFRQQLGDQASTFVGRAEYDANTLRLTERLQDLTDRFTRTQGQAAGAIDSRTEQRLNIGQALVAASVVIGVIAVIVTILVSRGV